MIEVDGVQPDLAGTRCEELLCQQYWHEGELRDEADIVFLKIAGTWHQLYFDSGVVHWRRQEETPQYEPVGKDAVFSYPLVDLGSNFGVRDRLIDDCQIRETADGETVTLIFQQGATLSFINRGDSTGILYQE